MARDMWAEVKMDFQNLKDSPNRIKKGMKRGINEVMQEVFDESQELVPVDTGALRDSGVFITAQEDIHGVEASISYGNALVTYAVDVHEDLQTFHEPPTQAKFLEIPMTNHQDELLHAIKRRINQNL